MTDFARPFVLDRLVDHSGVSGPGVVADGVEFPDGRVALRWRGPNASTNAHDDIANVLRVHGHDGDTRVLWPDEVDVQGAAPTDIVHLTEEQQASDVPEVDDDPLPPGDVLRTRDEALLQLFPSPNVVRTEISRIQTVARRYRDELSTVDAALRTAGIPQAGALGVSDLAARCRELTEQLTAVHAELIGLRPAATPSTDTED